MKLKLRKSLVALMVAAGFGLAPGWFAPDAAEAHGLGTARRSCRRTARRTSKRVVRRHMYALPAGYTTTVVSGTTVYVVDGVKYKAVIIDGKTAYMPM